MKATYRYIAFSIQANGAYPGGRQVWRPMALATIRASNGRSIQWVVVPDSGADSCLLPLSVARTLKLDLARLPRAQTMGVGGQVITTYHSSVSIDLGQGIAFDAYVGFSQGMEAVGTGMLGQFGFFDRYNVEFRHGDRIFTVEPRG